MGCKKAPPVGCHSVVLRKCVDCNVGSVTTNHVTEASHVTSVSPYPLMAKIEMVVTAFQGRGKD